MKLKKFTPLFRGLAATTASLLALSTVGYTVAMSEIARPWVDGWTKTERTIYEEEKSWVDGYTIPGSFDGYSYKKGRNYETTYESAEAYVKALKEHAIRQGEEGFALLKNDNDTLPLNKSSAGKNVAIFGWSGYNLPAGHTGVAGGGLSEGSGRNVKRNLDKITLDKAFDAIDGITLNTTITSGDFTGAMTSAGKYASTNPPEKFTENSDWKIDKNTTTGIVVVGRGGGEGNTWKPDSLANGQDPLALSEAEKNMIKYAKDNCAKVVLLVVSANAMELGPAVEKGGQYEVDAIGFCGIPNNYQYQGIANVLAGKVNATGALTDTYVYDNSFTPAVINMGQQQYEDTSTITSFNDPLGRNAKNYYANNYIVEAEGIYVGYKYYETRYYDSIVNSTFNAKDTVGSTKAGEAWDYKNEVVFTFGHGLSYTPYSQKVTDVKVDLSEYGDITATVEVTNEGTKDDYFLAQLYVNKPYTTYDIKNHIEKSAIDFLNSKKVHVKAGETETIEISLPTHYLASWDSSALNGAGTYVLDEGDYYFTAAAGAHEAVNNVLEAQGKTTDGTTSGTGAIKWEELKEFDDKTFSVSNGVEVRNQMENADINYFLGEGTVTYLSRSDWKATFPKNYTNYVNGSGIPTEEKFTIKGAEKEEEWLTELISAQYKVTPSTNENDWEAIDGATAIAEAANYSSVYAWILSIAETKPEAFNNIHSEEWQKVAAAIPVYVALASTGISGHATKPYPGIENPGSVQSESVAGYDQQLKTNDGLYELSVASNTLLASSFNPELAAEWGDMEGEGGLWLQKTKSPSEYSEYAVTVWGGGLNQHRHPYCGRNSEYMSEDPMLTNRIGAAQFKAATAKGAIVGPKHMGFNDQELNREGNACYMTEQKVRETDTRCYEGAMRVHEGNATGVMMSFARIGATNTTNSVGYCKNIIRDEWGFTGMMTTDMGKGNGYHEVGALIMATVNQYASMSGAQYPEVGKITGTTTLSNAAHIKYEDARKDPVFVAQARQTALYQIYTIAHSGSGYYVEEVKNMGEDIVVDGYWNVSKIPTGEVAHASWEYIFIALEAVFGVLTGVAAIAWIASLVIPGKEEN